MRLANSANLEHFEFKFAPKTAFTSAADLPDGEGEQHHGFYHGASIWSGETDPGAFEEQQVALEHLLVSPTGWRPLTVEVRELASETQKIVIDTSKRLRNRPIEPSNATDAPRARGKRPAWLGPVVARLQEIAQYGPGWDSYNAVPVGRENIRAAFAFMRRVLGDGVPAPSLVALPRGGLQIEWHRAGLDAEIEFSNGLDLGLYFRDRTSGFEWEGPSEAGFQEFRLGDRLSRPL